MVATEERTPVVPSPAVRRRVPGNRRLLYAILAGFFLIASTYSLAAPLWEASDESEHFQYIRYLIEHHTLPTELPSIQPNGNTEANQPPLYYLLAVPFALGVDLSDADRIRLNPHMGWKNAPDANASAAHVIDEEWPYHGAFLAAHRVRILSALLGTITLAITYAIALTCTASRSVAILAVALLACLPGFLFASATIDNDVLVNSLASVLLLIAARFDGRSNRSYAALYGVVAALALLTKLDALPPIVVGGAALILRSRARQRLSTALFAALPALPAVAFIAWRFLHGQHNLIGDRVGWPPPLPGSEGPLDWSIPVSVVRHLWVSLIGVFGRQTVFLPPVGYAIYGLILVIGVAGAMVAGRGHMAHRTPVSGWNLLWWWSALPFAAILGRFILLTGDRTGYDSSRFAFTALPAIATVVAYGWRYITDWLPMMRRLAAPSLAAGLVAAAAIPWLIIRPAYQPPYPVVRTVPPGVDHVAGGAFGGPERMVVLAGLDLPAHTLEAGQGLYVTFYWQVEQPLPDGTVEFVHLVSDDNQSRSIFDAAPLSGSLPLSFWRKGDVVIDREVITLPKDLKSGMYRFNVGWYNPKNGSRVPLQAGGDELTATTISITVASAP